MEQIIECFNQYLQEKRKSMDISYNGYVILHKRVIPNKTFKAIKTYKINVWLADKKEKHLIKELEISDRVLTGHEDKINRRISAEILNVLFELFENNEVDNIIKGEYRYEAIKV